MGQDMRVLAPSSSSEVLEVSLALFFPFFSLIAAFLKSLKLEGEERRANISKIPLDQMR